MPKTSLFDWIKNNKLVLLLIIVILYLVFKPKSPGIFLDSIPRSGTDSIGLYKSYDTQEMTMMAPEEVLYSSSLPTPERKVTTATSLSIQVEDVAQSIQQIQQQAEARQGFLINSSLDRPEEGASGYISVQVQTQQLLDFLEAVRNLGLKVVSEYVSGRDITDQYTNVEERLRLLNSTKTKFEAILSSATEVSDMLEVQRELLSLQSQIDSLEGQRRYMQESVDYSRVTVYLATDEMALPYAPITGWNPRAIYRQAVRSLVTSVRGLASAGIWVVVYSPLWVPAAGIIWIVNKKRKQNRL